MNCIHCGRALFVHPNYPLLYDAPCPCRMQADGPPVAPETLEKINAGIDRYSKDPVATRGLPMLGLMLVPQEPLKPPMEWLRELSGSTYTRAIARFRSYPNGLMPTERRNAMREAFWWGHYGSEEYYFWRLQNGIWMEQQPT